MLLISVFKLPTILIVVVLVPVPVLYVLIVKVVNPSRQALNMQTPCTYSQLQSTYSLTQSMVEGSHYGDSLTVVLEGDISVTVALQGGVLTAKSTGSEIHTITTEIDTLTRFTKWRYLPDRVFTRLTFALYNVFCPFSAEYIQYTPSQGFSRLTSSDYKALKQNMYNLATKPIQQVRTPTGRVRADDEGESSQRGDE